MISTLLDRLFQRQNVTSGTQVKQRLKFILAHDRAAIEPQVFENMRHEIMRVVSKYVELDEGSLDIRLESDKRMTALIANLPIKMVREELPDLASLFDEDTEKIDAPSNSDTLALEMDQSAEAALDAIMAKEIPNPNKEDISPESIAIIAERTIEVTSKIRLAATKGQDVGDRVVVEPEEKDIPSEVPIALDSDNQLDNSIGEKNEKLDDQSTDQLELSLGVTSDPEIKQAVIEESL